MHHTHNSRSAAVPVRAGLLAALILLMSLVGCTLPARQAGAPTAPAAFGGGDVVAAWHPVEFAMPTAPAAAAGPQAAPGTVRSYADGMAGLYVPAGEFLMGAAAAVPVDWPDERPQHRVYLDGFWIDRTEVTNAMLARCVQAGACSAPPSSRSYRRTSYYGNPDFDNFPAIYIPYPTARQYCLWASRRLPTEAEWEKAARGTDGRQRPWGDEPPDTTRGNGDNDLGDTVAVGSYPAGASPYGALDMAGNVGEWVSDLYSDSYYKNSTDRNPTGSAWGSFHVIRGASWSVTQRSSTAADRAGYGYRVTEDRLGFRCASSP